MEGIIAAVITGGLALLGVIITNNANSRKLQAEMEKNQAVTQAEMKELTREVREHNNFARRMPVVEEAVRNIERRIDEYHDPRRAHD